MDAPAELIDATPLAEPAAYSLFLTYLRSGGFFSEDGIGFPEYGYKPEDLQLDYIRTKLMIVVRLFNEDSVDKDYVPIVDKLETELRELYQVLINLDLVQLGNFSASRFIESLDINSLVVPDDYEYWKSYFGNLIIKEWLEGYPVSNYQQYNFNALLISTLCLVLQNKEEFEKVFLHYLVGNENRLMVNLLKYELFRKRDEMESTVNELPLKLKRFFLEKFKAKLKKVLTLPINI